MTPIMKKEIEKQLLRFKGAESSYPFGPEALVFKVMGRMFALISQQVEPSRLTLKSAPADAEVLVSQFDSIVPGYHMNKRHWITISLTGELPLELLIDLATTSYQLVVGKLSMDDRSRLEKL